MTMTAAQRKGAVLAAAEDLRRHPEWWCAASCHGDNSRPRDLFDHIAGGGDTYAKLVRAGFTRIDRENIYECSANASTAAEMHANAVKLCEELWPGVEPEYPPVAYERGLVPEREPAKQTAFERLGACLRLAYDAGTNGVSVQIEDLHAIGRFASTLETYAAQCEGQPHVMRAYRRLFEVRS